MSISDYLLGDDKEGKIIEDIENIFAFGRLSLEPLYHKIYIRSEFINFPFITTRYYNSV